MAQTRILIVEDEPAVRADLREYLDEFGYVVVGEAANAEKAIALAEEHDPDLILMDIKLEGEDDGIHAASTIRSALRIPVIFLTAYADEDTLTRAKVSEPYGYVLKPYKPLELRTAIEIALHRRRTLLATEDEFPSATETILREEKENSARNASIQTDTEPSTPSATRKIPKGTEAVSSEQLISYLEDIEPFNQLPRSILAQLAESSAQKTYNSGELITLEGEENVSGFLVLSGRVALAKSSAGGKDLVVELLMPGDPFGLLVAFDRQPYPFTTKAQLKSELLWIAKAELLAVLDTDPKIAREFIQSVFDRLRNAHNTSRGLAQDSVEKRIAAALLALMDQQDIEVGDLKGLEMTRQELSEYVGSTTETTIRVTKAFEREGILDLSTPKVIRILKPDALSDLVESL